MEHKLYFNQNELDNTQVTKVFDDHHRTQFLIMGTWGIAGDGFTVYSPQGVSIVEIKQLTSGKDASFILKVDDQQIMKSIWHRSFLANEVILLSSSWRAFGNRRTQRYQLREQNRLIARVIPMGNRDQGREITISTGVSDPIVVALAAALGHPQMPPLLHRRKGNNDQPDFFGV